MHTPVTYLQMLLSDGQQHRAHVLQLCRKNLNAGLQLLVKGLVCKPVHLKTANQFVLTAEQRRQEGAFGLAQKHHSCHDVFVLCLPESGCVQFVQGFGDIGEVKSLTGFPEHFYQGKLKLDGTYTGSRLFRCSS